MRTRLATLLCVAAMLVMALGPATALADGPLYVSLTGNDGNDCLSAGAACLTIQGAITKATGGETINVAAGTYVEAGQIVIGKNLNIVGASTSTTIIKTNQNTGTEGDPRGWFLISAGANVNLSKVTLDGAGFKVFQALRFQGQGSIDQVALTNIKYQVSGNPYAGTGVAVLGATPAVVNVTNSSFSEIGRIGIIYYGQGSGTASGNTLVGKGVGDWLDYGVEVGGGGHAVIKNNIFKGFRGIASSDGSTSAAIALTTYYGSGTEATITGNTITDSSEGIGVGYSDSDASTVVARYNSIFGNSNGISITGTNVTVDARFNWWGSPDGPGQNGNNGADSPAVTTPFETLVRHEVGETGYLPAVVTMGANVYGAQLVVNDSAVAHIKTGVAHNLPLLAPPWSWDFFAQDFSHPASGQTVLAGTMVSRTSGANLAGQQIATWMYTCAGVGTAAPTYDPTAKTGTLFSNKDGENVDATLTALGSVNCLAATANAVTGTMGLQGRVQGAASPTGWNGAVVRLTCTDTSGGCFGFGPYDLTSNVEGLYQRIKVGPGTGVVPGTYSASVSRRAYLGATYAGPVEIGLDTTSIPGPSAPLLGGDVDLSGKVDITDLSTIGTAFGQKPALGADTGADINGDDIVNIFDLVLAGGNYDKSISPW